MADRATLPPTTPRRAGIPTTHRGIEYRSRLEARWAAFFHNIGWDHTYEPFDGHGYIPDFLIHGERPLLVEVKPAVTRRQYLAPIDKVEAGLADWDGDVLIVGATPFAPDTDDATWGRWPMAGVLGESADGRLRWGAGLWNSCGSCHAASVFHNEQSYASRPCGCYEGDTYIHTPPMSYLHGAWADACNDVKWRAR